MVEEFPFDFPEDPDYINTGTSTRRFKSHSPGASTSSPEHSRSSTAADFPDLSCFFSSLSVVTGALVGCGAPGHTTATVTGTSSGSANASGTSRDHLTMDPVTTPPVGPRSATNCATLGTSASSLSLWSMLVYLSLSPAGLDSRLARISLKMPASGKASPVDWEHTTRGVRRPVRSQEKHQLGNLQRSRNTRERLL